MGLSLADRLIFRHGYGRPVTRAAPGVCKLHVSKPFRDQGSEGQVLQSDLSRNGPDAEVSTKTGNRAEASARAVERVNRHARGIESQSCAELCQ
jgi:hypothetical protein